MSELKEVTIYTDGGCIGNPGPGGYGVILCYKNQVKQLSGGFRLTTNNRMEIMAAIAGLEALKLPCSVTLYSDSKYLVDAIMKGWVHRWKANNWRRSKRKRAANVDLWDRLLDLCDQHTVKFVWVEGHAGNQWNEKCDALSREAANQDILPIDEGYEKHRDQPVLASQLIIEGLTSGLDPAPDPKKVPCAQRESSRHERSKQVAPEDSKEAKTQATHHRQIELEGGSYVWTGATWYDAKTFLKPPGVVIRRLNDLLILELEREDDEIRDVDKLLKRAREARDSLQDRRAEKLVRRVLAISPSNLGALAILSSCLRARGFAQQALDETEAFKTKNYPPLLSSRAAALCDLGRWEEAKKLVGRVLAIGTDKDTAFSIVHRIKNARPDL